MGNEEEAQAKLHIRLLGDFRVVVGEQPVTTLNTPRLRAFLAYLLVHHNASRSRQNIAFLFWPDSSEEQALANLRNLLSTMRRILPILGNYIEADHNQLRWRLDASLDVDIVRFESALDQARGAARDGNVGAQQAFLQTAIDVYRGDLLPGSYEDWVFAERERLQQRFTGALETLIDLFEREGNVHGAIEASQRLLRHNPLHEAMYKRLMDLYAANNMVAEALRIYHTCTTTLERELGVEPSSNTREAYERLLGSRKSAPSSAHTTHTSSAAPDAYTVTPPTPTSPMRVVTPLFGRATEWELLKDAWREASKGPRAVLVRGEAGIGKTRLVEELFNWLVRQGLFAASARCYPIERQLAFGPVTDWLQMLPVPPLPAVWLSEVARLLPGILATSPPEVIPAPAPLTEAWQRRRFMEALARVLTANQPVLLTLDDLQWCDIDTLQFLHFLMRYDPTAPLLLVMTARSEEIDVVPDADRAQALAHLLDALEDRLLEIDLTPLDPDFTAELAATLSGGKPLDPRKAGELYRETEGNPLFVVEMLRMGWLDKGPPASHRALKGPSAAPGLPPRIARVLNSRLSHLSLGARSLVDFAAVIGRDFTASLLQLASNESESVIISALDELWQRRIVREQGEEGYDFSHDKLRQAAYSALTSARRRMLHTRVAHALEVSYAHRLDVVSAQLGMHYEMAGKPVVAVNYYQRAAEAARRLSANAEAIHLNERAFVLAQQIAADGSLESRARVAEAGTNLADLLEIAGDHTRARSTYEQALAGYPASQPLQKARLLLKIGDTWRAQRDLDKAAGLYNSLDALLGDEPYEPYEEWWELRLDSALARLMTHYWLNEPAKMQSIVEKVQTAMERHGTPVQKMKYYRSLTTIQLRLDRYSVSDMCLHYARTALEETRRLDSLTELADTTFLMGFCLLWRADLPGAVDHLIQALSLTERTGQADYELLSLAYLSVAYRMQGDVQRTRETVARHVARMESVQMPSYSEFAGANLAWAAWKEGDLAEAKRYAAKALPVFSKGESFTWLITWPLVALSLAEGQLADAVRFASAQLAPHAQRVPDALIAAVKGAVEAWERQEIGEAEAHLREALDRAKQCRYL